MMRRFTGIFVSFVALMAVAAACAVDGPSAGSGDVHDAPLMSEDVVSGQLLVCFEPHVSDVLDRAGITKSGQGPMTRSGILSVDEILSLVDGYEIERVFPVDSRTEGKAREAGLHLWYIVRFSEEHSVAEVAADLSRLGEVRSVEFNRTLKRAADRRPVPLTSAMLRELTGSSEDVADPLYGLQWYLSNDGSLQEKLVPAEEGETVPVKFLAGADIGAEKAWEKCTGHPSIVVAVLDEGVDVTHPDLAASMWVNPLEEFGSVVDADGNGYAGDRHGYNFVKNTGRVTVNSRYDTGHGTHVAGTIAARNDNGTGIRSIAGGDGSSDSGVRIMSCQIFAGEYVGTVLEEVRAIKYAADNGAVVLQCSWGYISGSANQYEWGSQFATDEEWITYNPLEKIALDYFTKTAGSPDGVIDGGIAVFAGGNESAPAAGYPGAYKDFISVAAVAADYTPATYSNYGPGTTISAPGGDQDYYFEFGEGENMGVVGCILSTLPAWHTEAGIDGLDGDFTGYGYMEGTSMACPQVSGIVALGLSYALQQRKHFKAQDFIRLIHDSARKFDESVFAGEKKWYKYVIDMGQNHPSLLDLTAYRNKMGAGLVNAANLLDAIDGVDAPLMTFPNVLLVCGDSREIDPSAYFAAGGGSDYVAESSDPSVADVSVIGGRVVISAKAAGQTSAVVRKGSESQGFVVTVKDSGSSEGWL